MKQFSRSAKMYIFIVLSIGGAMSLWQLTNMAVEDPWLLLAVCGLAAILQGFKIEGTTIRTSYNLSWVVYGFSLFLLGPSETMLVIIVAHLVEWILHRYPWYIQSFNIASLGIAVTVAGLAFEFISPSEEPLTIYGCLAILTAAALFTFVNHILVGFVIKLARGQSLADSGVLDKMSLSLDFGMLCLGAAGALIWLINPYAIILIALLAILLQNVLRVPMLRRQTETDPKVGLFNSRYLAKTVEEELNRANKFNRPLTLVMADMDYLRRVNNVYGHLAGDVVLRGVAQILQDSAREYDIVARFGGEEFAILMPETKPNQAYEVVEAMRVAIEEKEFSVSTSETPIKVTMSFGVAGRLEQDMTADDLIHQADLAVYRAKQEGRNCARVFGKETKVSDKDSLGKIKPIKTKEELEKITEPAQDGTPIKLTISQSKPSELSKVGSEPKQPIPSANPAPPWKIRFYIGAVTGTALLLVALLVRPNLDQDWVGLAAFALLVVLVEALAIHIYVKETSVSTSAAPLVAGVLLFGPIGAIILGPAVALAAFIRERSQFDRLIFNTSNHLIDGLMVAGIVVISGRAFTEWSMPVQIVITFLGISLVYLSSTVLIAGAISISSQQPIKEIWGERFRWLFPYYLALGVAAYALSFSYFTAGLIGIVVVLIPLIMLRYSQKQYIDHTEAVVAKLRSTNVKLTQQAEEITLLNEELLVALAKATDMRDPYVMEHSLNVARYAELIAKELGLPSERTELVRKAGLLHDIGKLAIPDAILFKPEKLTDEEYGRIKDHVTTGADLIDGCHSLHPLIPIIRHHHEYYDGSGYPGGLAGELIPLEARILGVSDALEAMASDRPYRKGRTPEGIIEELKRWSGKQFDPMVVEAFIRVVQKQGESVIINSARDVQARQEVTAVQSEKEGYESDSEGLLIQNPLIVSS